MIRDTVYPKYEVLLQNLPGFPSTQRDGEPTPKAMLLKRLAQNHVNVYTSMKVTAIEADAVVGEKDGEEVRISDIDTEIFCSYN